MVTIYGVIFIQQKMKMHTDRSFTSGVKFLFFKKNSYYFSTKIKKSKYFFSKVILHRTEILF